jgi:microcystin-dependent protein
MSKQFAIGDEVLASDLNDIPPVGAITLFPVATAPTDWIVCDGASLERAGTYASLFAIIGTTFGSADGSHFNVPNLKGKVPVGLNASETEWDTLGETGGEKTHQISTAEMPAHTHTVNKSNSHVGGGVENNSGGGSSHTVTTSSKGSNTAHNNLMPYITLQYVIKYQ